MLTKEKLDQICHFPNTKEKQIIKVLWEQFTGAVHIDTLCQVILSLTRDNIFMHIRKSIYMVRDKKTAIVKLIRKPDPRQGSVYGRLYDSPNDATNIQDYCFSIYWIDDTIKPDVVNKMVINFAKEKHLGFYGFVSNKNIRETILKGVRKFKQAQ